MDELLFWAKWLIIYIIISLIIFIFFFGAGKDEEEDDDMDRYIGFASPSSPCYCRV